MTTENTHNRVASVGSPSTNSEITVDLSDTGRDLPLVGAMLALTTPLGEADELAIGTVTEVTTRNRWHEDPAMRGALHDGGITGISGDGGDSRQATIKLQAAWRRDLPTTPWKASGPSLRMSPATGTAITLVDDALIHTLTETTPDLHYAGHLGGTDGVRLPLNLPDFAGPAGAFHTAVYGMSGSGKALSLNTPIPTPNGWTTMGELKDGDVVFDDLGRPTLVVKAHEVLYERECYEVVFSDGSIIAADAEHLWETETAYARQRQSLERTGVRRRRRLIAEETCIMLQSLADLADPLDVITIPEIVDLPGMGGHKGIVTNQAKRVGAAGTIRRPIVQSFGETEQVVERIAVAWPACDVIPALRDNFRARANSAAYANQIALLDQAEAELGEGVWLTSPDVARILGRPPRNAALTMTLKSLPVPAQRRPMRFARTQQPYIRTIPSPVEVTTYPKATLLSAIAAHGSNTWRDQRDNYLEPQAAVRTTREILETLHAPGKNGAANHAVRVAKALELPAAHLPIDPYTLGVWLGDGDSRTSHFYGADPEIATFLAAEGHNVHIVASQDRPENPNYHVWRINGLTQKLREQGLIQRTVAEGSQKHIPAAYLRSSIAQRRMLLAGLLDTDGTVSLNGNVNFDNTNERLARGVLELALSLGYRATITSRTAYLNGKDCGLVYRISWTTSEPVFRLTRKRRAQAERTKNYNPSKNAYRYIVEVRSIESVPMRCITVDSPSHLYLAGEAMIPTHNTQMTAYLLAGQMRHRDHGIIIVDPQGQWAAEEGMAFSVQGFAAELGRDVRVRRISDHLQLPKNAELLAELLSKTRFLPEILKMSGETQTLVFDEVAKIVRATPDWQAVDSRTLMRAVLSTLVDEDARYLGRIYADETRQQRLREAIDDILSDSTRETEVLDYFAAIHNLFQAANPVGAPRHSLWSEITAVFDRDPAVPAPLLILDMSSKPAPGMNDEAAMAAARAYEVLENDIVKAAILRNLFSELKRASEDRFRNGKNLNTLVVLDEAWRYAPNPQGADEDEISALSRDLAGYARDTRKFGIGWLYISQSTRSVNQAIWEQMSVRTFGFGLTGQDRDKIAEIVDDRSMLKLYQGFGNPRSTGRYPFLLTGPVSPLAANATPVVLNVYTDFQDFRDDNISWIQEARDRLALPLLAGVPVAPTGSAARPLPKVRGGRSRDHVAAIVETNTAVKENLASSGVRDAAGLGNPLDSLGDDLPF